MMEQRANCKFLAFKSILVLNHSPCLPDLASCDLALFFVPKIENEEKAVRNYFRHPEGFDRDYFDHLKGRFSEFLKLCDCYKHCISLERIYFANDYK